MRILNHLRLINANLELRFLKTVDDQLLDKWQTVRRLAYKAEILGNEQYATMLKAKTIKLENERTLVGKDISKLREKISRLEIEIALQS